MDENNSAEMRMAIEDTQKYLEKRIDKIPERFFKILEWMYSAGYDGGLKSVDSTKQEYESRFRKEFDDGDMYWNSSVFMEYCFSKKDKNPAERESRRKNYINVLENHLVNGIIDDKEIKKLNSFLDFLREKYT